MVLKKLADLLQIRYAGLSPYLSAFSRCSRGSEACHLFYSKSLHKSVQQSPMIYISGAGAVHGCHFECRLIMYFIVEIKITALDPAGYAYQLKVMFCEIFQASYWIARNNPILLIRFAHNENVDIL